MNLLLLFQIVLSTSNIAGTVSSDSKGILFDTFSDPVKVVRLPTNAPELAIFVLTRDNKLRIGSNATVSCTNCTQDNNMSLVPGEVDLGHAYAYNDKTWHDYFQLKTTKGLYLTWQVQNHSQTIAGFRIYRSFMPNGPFALAGVYMLAPKDYKMYSIPQWKDILLASGTQALYKVVAINSMHGEFLTSNIVQVTR